MLKDTLFLLAPGFVDSGRREYCPECAEIWGLLNYFPAIKESVELVYQTIERPRAMMQLRLGADNQNCPTLVLSDTSPRFENCGILLAGDVSFIDNARDIGRYYAERYGTPFPRGS